MNKDSRSMTRNKNLDGRQKINTCYNGGVTSWSDLNHDVLYSVMMRLGVVDFIAFSGVCKSWRSLALHNRNKFMASIPPMLMFISTHADKEECCLEDFEGRMFKTTLPRSTVGRTFVGLSCGYLIFFGRRTRDFFLVNPITRHELRSPPVPDLYYGESIVTPILVFPPSIFRWVFVILNRRGKQIWLSIDGEEWNHIPSAFRIFDIHAFKGQIYTMNYECRLCELTLDPESNPNLTELETKNTLKPGIIIARFVSSGENLYVTDGILKDPYVVRELDIGEMKWVAFEERRDEYAFFLSSVKCGVVANKLWADLWSQHRRYADIESGKARFFTAKLWYFPHEYMNVAW